MAGEELALEAPKPERWPELGRIKERFEARERPLSNPLMEMLAAVFERAAPLIERQISRMEEFDRMQAPGVVGMATNAVGTAIFTVPALGDHPPPGSPLAGPTGSLVPDPYIGIPPEDKELMEKLLVELGPDIKVQTEELFKTEIRDSMMLGGNWARLKQLIQSGEKPKIVRKRQGGRDPLYLQFGDGVTKEIEEIRFLG